MGGGGRKKAIAEINVTPFVDVMLVLLIIFMVAAPMLEQGLDLQLPQVRAQALPQTNERVQLQITRDGDVSVDGTRVPAARLDEALPAILRTRKEEPVYVAADEGVRYGVVARVLGLVRSAGATRIHLVTEEPKAK
jgi:biopolymer transport protein TolR